MASKEYRLIQQENYIEEVFTHRHDKILGFGNRRQLISGIVSITLALSLAANSFFIILCILHTPHEVSLNRTAFGKFPLELWYYTVD